MSSHKSSILVSNRFRAARKHGWRAVLGVVFLAAVLTAHTEPVRAASHHRMVIEGQGEPTVVFEAGLGDTLDTWRPIQMEIAGQCTRTVTYTRAGYPGSAAASGTRDAATVVNELRWELARRNVRPPYVLVGHSLGGLYMQYFARQYPEEVAGLVLVDSTHREQQLPNESSARRAGRAVVLYMPLIVRREFNDSILAGEQVSASPPPSAVPTIVLSSTRALRGETPASRALAARFQDELAKEFPGARHVRVFESGHYIHVDRPEIVTEAVREVVGCTS